MEDQPNDIHLHDVKEGMCVDVRVKDELVRGYVKRLLSYDSTQDVKVELRSGTVGIVYALLTKSDLEKETFKFYNLFFHSNNLLTIGYKDTKKFFVHALKRPAGTQTERTIFLFSDDALAKEFLLELDRKDLAVRRISRRKPILENFKGVDVDCFRLDEQRKATVKKLGDLEKYFSQF